MTPTSATLRRTLTRSASDTELPDKVEYLRSLNEAADLEDTLSIIVNSAARLSGAMSAVLLLLDDAGLSLIPRVASSGNAAFPELTLPLDDLTARILLQASQSVLCDDRVPPSLRPLLGLGSSWPPSAAIAPLRCDGRLLGAIVLAFAQRPPADLSASPILGSFFEQASLALRRAVHLAALDTKVRLLSEISIENTELLETQRQTVAQLRQLNQVVDQQREGLARTLRIHDDFTAMILDGLGIPAIVASLGRLLANPVAVEDRFANLLAYYPPPDHGDLEEVRRRTLVHDANREAVRDDPAVRNALARLRRERRPVRLESLMHVGLDQPRVLAPIVVGPETMGHVYVVESNRPLDELDLMAVQRAATAIALQMMKEKAAVEAQYKLRGDLVAELLCGGRDSDDLLFSRAVYLGIDLHVPRTVAMVAVDDLPALIASRQTEEQVLALKTELFAVVERACCQVAPDCVVAARRDEIMVLTPVAGDGSTNGRLETSALADSLRAAVVRALPEDTVSVGIGGPCHTHADYRRSYQQARSALDVVKAFRQRDRTLAFDDLGIYGVLFDPHNRDKLVRFVDATIRELLEYDRVHSTQLTATLHHYLLLDCRLEQTAEALHVHLNTLRYRLRRVEEIMHTDLRSFESRCNLHLALKVLYGLHLA